MPESTPIPVLDASWSAADEEALAHVAQRTPALFKKLYLRWVTPVYKYLLYQVGNERDAEDITSQAFLKAFAQLPRYQHRGYFAAWLFAIARNSARDHFRKSTQQVSIETAENSAVSSDPLDEVIRTDEMRRLDGLIRALPEAELELIRLRYVAGLSYAEIGAIVRRSEEAIRKALARQMARLHSQMEDHNE